MSELLHELKGQPSAAVGTPSPAPPAERAPYREVRGELPAASFRCPACDAENRPQQRFCGFCGLPLRRGEPGMASRTPYAPSRAVTGGGRVRHAGNPLRTGSILGSPPGSTGKRSAVSAVPAGKTIRQRLLPGRDQFPSRKILDRRPGGSARGRRDDRVAFLAPSSANGSSAHGACAIGAGVCSALANARSPDF